MAHSKGVLAAFQSGETRLIYARHRADGTLYLLKDGTAASLRQFTRENLRCIVEDCPDPNLKSVSRSKGRDGFSHHAGAGGHAPEGPFHIQACEMIAVWLREKYVRSTVRKEQPSNKSSERIADVMITAPNEERSKVAFEIQYASLTVASWQNRHDSYARQKIPDAWLFGHYGHHLKAAGEDEVALSAVHEAVAASGSALLWINPITRQVGTVSTCVSVAGTVYEIPAFKGRGRGRFLVDELEDCHLTEAGFMTPHLTRLRRNKAEYDAALEAEARAAATLRATEERARAQAEARAVEQAAAVQRRRDDVVARSLAATPAWLRSELRSQILTKHDGVWPEYLDVPTTAYPGTPVPHQQWQAELWSEFIDGKPVGFHVESVLCAQFLTMPGLKEHEIRANVREWLDVIADEDGPVAAELRTVHFKTGVKFTVARPRSAAQLAADDRAQALQWAAAERTVQHHAAEAAAYKNRMEDRAAAMEPVAGNPECVACHRPLFNVRPGVNLHKVCVPGWRL